MKQFYVMNLDMRRIAILVGGAMVALGVTLFVGMAIGRSQGERNARVASEEAQQQKLGLTPDMPKGSSEPEKLVLASGPSPVEHVSAEKVIPSVPEAKSEIPLMQDPLVQGPPHKGQAARKFHHTARKSDSTDAVERKPVHKRKALARASAKEDAEVSGSIDHSAARRRRVARRRKSADSDTTENSASADANAGDGRYTIQVAAFKRSSEAKTLIDKLNDEGIKARSEKTGNYFLVTVGRTKSKNKLEKALTRLKELEYNAYIRKLRPHGASTTDDT